MQHNLNNKLNNKLLTTGLMTLILFNNQTAWAFGKVEAIVGKVAVVNQDGNTRELTEGSRIEATDTIVTGESAELLIKTDDDGVVFLKPNSKLIVESFSAKGNNSDNFAVKLLKGAFRGVTGFIGKTAPKRYRLSTPTATIGIRGTDYDAAVVEGGTDTQAGTYAKVNMGEISLTSRGIGVNVAAKQFAVAPTNAPPQLLDAPPAGLFGKNQLDDKIDQLIQSNIGGIALQTGQAEQARGGGAVASGETRIPENCAGNNPAQRTLDDFIAAYERGDIGYIQRRLDPAMIGYGPFLNGMMEDVNAKKQIRFLIQNRNAQCGADLAVISFRWEKRFLDLVTFEPRLQTGQAAVLTYLKAGEWRLSGISGDNPFASGLNAAGVLTANPAQTSYASLPKTCTPPTSVTTNTVGSATVGRSVYSNGANCSFNPYTTSSCSFTTPSGTVPGTITGYSSETCTIYTQFTSAGLVASGNKTSSYTGAPLSNVLVISNIPVSGTVATPYPQAYTGVVTCQASLPVPAGTPVCAFTSTTTSTQLKLVSPNQAKAGSVQVEALANNGDREVLTLNETSPGVFTRTGFNIAGGAVSPNNGVITVNGPTTITFRFIDPKSGEITSTVFRISS